MRASAHRGRRNPRHRRRRLLACGLTIGVLLLFALLDPMRALAWLTALEYRLCRLVTVSADVLPPPIVMAHRGCMLSRKTFENSAAGIETVVDAGYEGIEIDVIFTKDLVPIVFHDPWLGRLTDRKGRVDELPWKELREIPLLDGQPILLLADFWDRYADQFKIICIDVKGGESHAPQRAQALSSALVMRNPSPRTLVVGVPFKIIHELSRLRPDLSFACERFGVVANWSLGFDAVSASYKMFSPGQAGLARFLGMTYMTWTINSDEQLWAVRKAGVTCFLTDRFLPAS